MYDMTDKSSIVKNFTQWYEVSLSAFHFFSFQLLLTGRVRPYVAGNTTRSLFLETRLIYTRMLKSSRQYSPFCLAFSFVSIYSQITHLVADPRFGNFTVSATSGGSLDEALRYLVDRIEKIVL